MTVEEEIRNHTKTTEQIVASKEYLFGELPARKFDANKPEEAEFLRYLDKKWVPLDVVLGVVAKAEAERNQELQAMIDSKKDFLRSFHVSVEEPQYFRLWGQIDLLKELLSAGSSQEKSSL